HVPSLAPSHTPTRLFVFPSMPPPPPRPTLFPYTTLFRSHPPQPPRHHPERRPGRPVPDRGDHLPRPPARHGPLDRELQARQRTQDRKSTRLNSSHVKISYAVFCLKKKKKKTTRTQHSMSY